MKKLLLGILIPVTVLVGGATTLFFLIRDTSQVQYQKTDLSSQEVFNRRIAESFSDTRESHAISFKMNQDDFNQIIALTYEGMNSSLKENLKGLEIKTEGQTYHIYVYAKASILSTKLDIACQFSQDEGNYYLTVSSIKAGALPMKNITFLVLKNVLKEKEINDMFSNSGLSLKADYENKRFVYAKDDAKNDLLSLMKKSMTGNEWISSLTENLFEQELISLDFTSGLQARIDLEPLNANEAFCSSSNRIKEEDYPIEEYKENVITLLKNQTIDINDNHPDDVFTYLLRGYSYLNDSQKEYIDSLNLSSIGLESDFEKKNHKGYVPSISYDIQGEIRSSVNDITKDGILLKEESLNSYLQSQGILGYNYLFAVKEDSSYILNYIALDNAYFNLIKKDDKEQMNMILGVSINGYETTLVLENTKKESLSYGMTLENENIYFGTRGVNESLKNAIYSLIQTNLPSNEFLTFDGQGTFTVNFEGYLKEYIETVNTVLHKKLVLNSSIEGKDLEDKSSGIRLKGELF